MFDFLNDSRFFLICRDVLVLSSEGEEKKFVVVVLIFGGSMLEMLVDSKFCFIIYVYVVLE